jgi:hypothetical protein
MVDSLEHIELTRESSDYFIYIDTSNGREYFVSEIIHNKLQELFFDEHMRSLLLKSNKYLKTI